MQRTKAYTMETSPIAFFERHYKGDKLEPSARFRGLGVQSQQQRPADGICGECSDDGCTQSDCTCFPEPDTSFN
jgi:hypothetical protein